MSTLTINNVAVIYETTWSFRNNGCGTDTNGVVSTINSARINGVQVGSLNVSDFPLTSGLIGYKISPGGIVYGGLNNIQLNVTSIPLNGAFAKLIISINGTEVYNQAFTTPFPTANGITINGGDDIEIQVFCFY